MLMPTDMSQWADGTRHYRVGGTDYAVEATLPDGNVIPVGFAPMVEELVQIIGDGKAPLVAIVRPTVVFACTEDGAPIDLTPLRTFPPGTTHDDAIAQLKEP